MNDKLSGILSMIDIETRYVNWNGPGSSTKDTGSGPALKIILYFYHFFPRKSFNK